MRGRGPSSGSRTLFLMDVPGAESVPPTKHESNALRTQALSDLFVRHGIRMIIKPAAAAFETSIVAERLSLISAFHEARYCGVELKSLREGREHETNEPDSQESSERRIRNDAINDSHLTALESRRKTAATSLVIALDRLFDAYWMKLGLPDWSVRGGPVIGGDVTMIELIHLCGNYLRHAHEWLAGDALSAKAKINIERLQVAGFDFREDDMLGRVVDKFPGDNFTDLEVAVLDFVEFMAWFTQEKSISAWAAANGASYEIAFNTYDDRESGYAELGTKLDRELGSKWKLPANPGGVVPSRKT